MKIRNFLFISLLLATSSAIDFEEEEPMKAAMKFHAEFVKFIDDQDIQGLNGMISKNFVFEDCQGVKHNSEEFLNLVMDTGISGKVSGARTEKSQVIYKVRAWSKVTQFVISKQWLGWNLEEVKALIC